jgi:hypothetical protein
VTRALTERYREHLAGVLSCYDRILITGTLPGACFAGGMTHILYSKGIRIFDYAQFAAPLRDRVRERAAAIAREAGIAIEHIAKRHILLACNQRYLAFLATLDDFSAGVRALDRITRPRSPKGKSVKPINFFSPTDQSLLRALHRPAFNIAGMRRADLKPLLAKLSPAALSRQLTRLRHSGLIRRISGTYRYYLTRIGRAAIAACCHITENVLIPPLA